jgi:arylsulfatase A-like enzyme
VQKVSRRSFLRTAILGSAMVSVGGCRKAHLKIGRKPNLLVLLPDQLRADLIANIGTSGVHAPNIQKLAAEAVTFDRAYVTHPICAPSRSSLLSGTWPHQNGCRNNKAVLPERFVCLPEMVGDRDYRTGYFGKWHLGDEFFPQHGFEDWVSIEEDFKSVRHRPNGRTSDYTTFLKSKGFRPDHRRGFFSLKFPTKLPFELSKTKFLEDKACAFIERNRHQPFIAFISFFEPHPPYAGPFDNEHSLSEMTLDESFGDSFGDDIPLRCRLRQQFCREGMPLAEDFRRIKRNYFGLITQVDRSVGAILAKIDDLGLRNRTIVVLTSDHGDMMGAHGLVGKQLMFEQSASVPYAVRVPGETARRCQAAISHIDFVPTMLELLGKPAHPQCAGESRARLIRSNDQSSGFVFCEWSPASHARMDRKTTLASLDEINRCIRESTRAVISPDGWKLCLRDLDKSELYNLRNDPGERQNLFYRSEGREAIGHLANAIYGWQEKTGDLLQSIRSIRPPQPVG